MIKLPKGVLPHSKAVTEHDYILTDPMNMRAADELLYQTVMDTRRAMDPAGVLYVVIGEVHSVPSHVLTQTGLLDKIGADYNTSLDPSIKPILTTELPYNALSWGARHIYGIDAPLIYKPQKIQKKDPLGHVFARAVLANNDFTYAPCAINTRLDAALRMNIPVVPVDVGRKKGNYLSSKDTLARTMAQDYYDTDLAEENVDCSGDEDPCGMEIRNDVMAERTLQAAFQHKAGIVLMQIGNAHFGHKSALRELFDLDTDEFPFETSYPARLADKIGDKDHIISIFCDSAHSEFSPEKAMPTTAHVLITPVVLRGLADQKFMEGEEGKERAFIAKLGQSYPKTARPSRFSTPALPDKNAMHRELEALLSPAL